MLRLKHIPPSCLTRLYSTSVLIMNNAKSVANTGGGLSAAFRLVLLWVVVFICVQSKCRINNFHDIL